MIDGMLPLIQINLSELCHVGHDQTGEKAIIAETTCYLFAKITAAAESAGDNIDRFLTKAVVAGLTSQPVKTPLLFWYAPHQYLLFLSLTDKRLKARCSWRHDIPGYYEQGQAPLPPNSVPIVYYDGLNIHRIYELPAKFDPEKYYISDFCGMGGLFVGETDAGMYRYIENNQIEKYDYSIVPRQSEEILAVNRRKHVLLHAFWTSVIATQ